MRFWALILLVIVTTWIFRDVLTIAQFELNQTEITDTWCVNKYEPITMCYGSCYLSTVIAENHSRTDAPSEATQQVELDQKNYSFTGALYFVEEEILEQNHGLFYVAPSTSTQSIAVQSPPPESV